MKKVLPFILSLSFLLQSFSYLVIYADYEANKTYIAKNLCENRMKPGMHCCGRCLLKKKMQEEERNESRGLPGAKEIKQNILFGAEDNGMALTLPALREVQFSIYRAGSSVLHGTAVFHPPLG